MSDAMKYESQWKSVYIFGDIAVAVHEKTTRKRSWKL